MKFAKMSALVSLSGCVLAALGAPTAFTKVITYGVNLNFNPLTPEASPGAGSVAKNGNRKHARWEARRERDHRKQ
jgi:hypothetical protein